MMPSEERGIELEVVAEGFSDRYALPVSFRLTGDG